MPKRWLVSALAGLALAGCGTTEGERAGDVTLAYFQALADRDAEWVCTHSTPRARREFGASCVQGVKARLMSVDLSDSEANQIRRAQVASVKITGDRARVFMLRMAPGHNGFPLVRIDGTWLLD